MNKLLIASLFVVTPLFATAAQATENATNVVFADSSYCGSFSGDIYNGKRFQLRLGDNQELVIRNKGNDQVNVAYVDAPRNSRLEGDYHRTYTSFYTQDAGTHVIKVYGTSHHSSVEFCAY